MKLSDERIDGLWREATQGGHGDTTKMFVRWFARAIEAELEKRALVVPDEIAAIIVHLHTQNNRITQDPLFAVQQKCRMYGVDEERCDGVERDEDGFTVGYVDRWDFVTGCLTEQGCKDFIRANGHNLNEPRIYAYGSYRNAEFIALRKWLMSLLPPAAQGGDGGA